MKRKTLKFLEKQTNGKSSFLNRISAKTVIIATAVLVAALILGGLYIWYVKTYGGARKIDIKEEPKLTYEWLQITSKQGITGDYLWSRTNSLMVDGSDNGVMIPSWYMIEGRLTSETPEESGVFKLSDQALLLKVYVRQRDRSEAKKLKSKVNDQIDFESCPFEEKMIWLEAYLEYYSVYGTNKDLKRVETMVDSLFDEKGIIKPVALTYASYNQGAFESLDQIDESNTGVGSLGESNGEIKDSYVQFNGVPLSAIRLRLISSLEENDFLPKGSYEANLKLVKDGIISSDISLYAYAYHVEDSGNISYVYAHNHAMAIGVSDSITTMRNLAEVNELDNASFIWLKNYILNGNVLKSDYYITSGNVDGNQLFDSYLDVMMIAYMKDDQSLFEAASYMEALRVATYNNSPALSMVYRENGNRYVFYASENLGLILALL